ncbi:pilus assembly protein TadG-related protein [Catellatospora chokoriensis]|uniref:Putative Flp pilus-assembly TadG-like N-terminal domain-containing protein n=1 Tax=Catellatospora chokoriensis TaxID=310353 RepID=A0A8J3K313_9ACTN|nr:pilus assembly protein TadG-related protein [Catellatospora chokoriensis]GIF89790.1 hypothetical protein Cch02nite_32340 [Catellatospora chokoriensis]
MTPVRWWRRDDGQTTAFTLIMGIAVLALVALVLDAGLAIGTKVDAVASAQAAARAGARELDLTTLRVNGAVRVDPVKARAAAQDWLSRAELTGTVTVAGDQVTVSVATSQPTQLLTLIGIDAIAVHATATAQAVSPP